MLCRTPGSKLQHLNARSRVNAGPQLRNSQALLVYTKACQRTCRTLLSLLLLLLLLLFSIVIVVVIGTLIIIIIIIMDDVYL